MSPSGWRQGFDVGRSPRGFRSGRKGEAPESTHPCVSDTPKRGRSGWSGLSIDARIFQVKAKNRIGRVVKRIRDARNFSSTGRIPGWR